MNRTTAAERKQGAGLLVVGVLVLASAAAGLTIPRFFDMASKMQNLYGLMLVGVLYSLALVVDTRGALWLGLLVAVSFLSVTGFQYELREGLRVSAVDCILFSLAVVLLVSQPRRWGEWGRECPAFKKALVRYFWLIPLGVVVCLLRGVDMMFAVAMIKHFYYPIIFLFVLPRIVQTRRQFALVLAIALVLASGSALRSRVTGPPLDQPLTGRDTTTLQRSAGQWGTQNPFANYLMFAVLVPLSFVLRLKNPKLVVPAAAFAGVAAWGLLGTFTRGAWLGCAAGATFLAGVKGLNRLLLLAVALAVVIPLLPAAIHERAAERQDSSTTRRLHWWETGWRATLRYPVAGGGWGSGFVLVGDTLYETPGGFPQWHNDYLSVSSQTGFIGMGVFLAMWWSLVAEGLRAARRTADPFLHPVLLGLTASIVASLTHAFFEPVFWRFDTGPHSWFLVSCLLTAITLARSAPTAETAPAKREPQEAATV